VGVLAEGVAVREPDAADPVPEGVLADVEIVAVIEPVCDGVLAEGEVDGVLADGEVEGVSAEGEVEGVLADAEVEGVSFDGVLDWVCDIAIATKFTRTKVTNKSLFILMMKKYCKKNDKKRSQEEGG
jgi:hypothetical protein